jgi:streptomycin 6-kinase
MSGALLMEWIDGRPFVEEHDTASTLRMAGDYLRRLHRPRPLARPCLPTLEEKLAPLRRSREEAERARQGAPILDEPTLRSEASVRAWLADPSRPQTCVIHGDLHPRNLLVRGDGGLSAIDPYGLVDDPCRDAASLALFFREDRGAVARLEALADFAELERDRVYGHAYALAIGAYRFRVAYGVSTGRVFLERVIGELRRRLSWLVGALESG